MLAISKSASPKGYLKHLRHGIVCIVLIWCKKAKDKETFATACQQKTVRNLAQLVNNHS